ncbi:MAG: prepilin-type N-terminal cleavage/methylation domain-containing protein [Planctomycetota bacterium]|jgi:prepilin-type N-terminal cleavage/methylation domain-containing protein
MITASARRTAAVLRRGFTLIEILAVMAIILILTWFLLPNVVDAYDMAEVRACSSNMAQMYQGMVTYKAKYEHIQESSGVAFFAELMARGAMTNTTTNARRLTCPAVDTGSLAIRDVPTEEWWMDLELLDGTWSSYAGRDLDRFPMRKFPGNGKEPLIGDDNDGGMNHATTTNVLYSDGSVHTFELFQLREEGLLGEEEALMVGPDSPIEDLRKLSLD